MKKKLVIVSTCTNNKRQPPDETCLLDTCSRNDPAYAVKEWVRRLGASEGSRCSARRLYRGSHWKESLQCAETAEEAGFDADLWVLSAGWGLIPVDFRICSYGATFASGENSIHNLRWPEEYTVRDRSRAWWRHLHRYRKVEPNWTLAQLPRYVDAEGDLCFIFILSREYFLAIEPELMELIGQGHDAIIVSAGLYSEIGSANPMVHDHILPLSDKFKQLDDYLNHTNVSLNARLANWLIKRFPSEIDSGSQRLFEAVSELDRSLPPMVRRSVEKMTDEEVLDFISKHYDADRSSATRMLRVLRHEEGKSCEQKRFGRLFRRFMESQTGGLFDG